MAIEAFARAAAAGAVTESRGIDRAWGTACLLYTSDAADE